MRSSFTFLAITALVSSIDAHVAAQQTGTAASMVERGAQAYLEGNDSVAESFLAQAIRADSNDPRPHYYRGLCLLRQGRPAEARDELLIGAELESRAQATYPIEQSLSQLPQAEQLILDRFRWRTGVVRAVTQPVNDPVEQPRPIATDAAVLRRKVAVRLDQLMQPTSLSELVQASAQEPSHSEPLPAEPTGGMDVGTEQLPSGDPFADDQAPGVEDVGQKIPSSKLMGILGRTILKSTPLPSLDSLRDKVPPGLLPPADDDSPAAASNPAAATADDDLFFEPSTPPADEPPSDEPQDENETEVIEEDPFG